MPRLQDSKHERRVEKSHLPKDAPKILIIMLGDVGFGLPDTYGGPIQTPTLYDILGIKPPKVVDGFKQDQSTASALSIHLPTPRRRVAV
ncbi:MAG: hypothetical protein WBP94_02855 [Rhodomicrobiaceae bacterium]